ncbi:MAG: hypothetical protein ACFCUV_16865 [Rivularia sp. (in: cyanobacteria)]
MMVAGLLTEQSAIAEQWSYWLGHHPPVLKVTGNRQLLTLNREMS